MITRMMKRDHDHDIYHHGHVSDSSSMNRDSAGRMLYDGQTSDFSIGAATTSGDMRYAANGFETELCMSEALASIPTAATGAGGVVGYIHHTTPGGLHLQPFAEHFSMQASASDYGLHALDIETHLHSVYPYVDGSSVSNLVDSSSSPDSSSDYHLDSINIFNNIVGFGMQSDSSNLLSGDDVSSGDESLPITPGSLSSLATTNPDALNTVRHQGAQRWTVAPSNPQAASQSERAGRSASTQMPTSSPPRLAYAAIGNTQQPFYSAEPPDQQQRLAFNLFQTLYNLWSDNGARVMPVIDALPVKGLAKEEHWTCYRRNYLSTTCSYSFANATPGKPMYLETPSGRIQIQAFALRLGAHMDSERGKEAELWQYTPKRVHKDPVKFDKICPRSWVNSSTVMPQSEAPLLPLQHEADESCMDTPSNGQRRHQAAFERIQFGAATQNNGKRRNHQQFYYLVVGLYADIRAPGNSEANWVKVAHKITDKLIVRGRSPGHYNGTSQSSRKQSGGPAAGGSSGARHTRGMESTYKPTHSGGGGAHSSISGNPAHGSYSYGGNSYTSFHQLGNIPAQPDRWHDSESNIPSVVKREREAKNRFGMTKAEEERYDNVDSYQYYGGSLQDLYGLKPTIKQECRSPPPSFSTINNHIYNPFMQSKDQGSSSTTNAGMMAGVPAPASYIFSPVRQSDDDGLIMAFDQRVIDFEVPRQLPTTFQSGTCSRFQGSNTSRGLYPAFNTTY